MIKKIPPGLLIKKAAVKLYQGAADYFNKLKDHKKSTYSYIESGFRTGIFPVDFNKELIKSASVREFIDKCLDHRFTLLGAKDQKISYDADYPGFEGISFNVKIDCKSPGEIIEKCINSSNQGRSKKIAELIPEGYKPIDWQRDFKSGYRWDSRSWYKDIKFGTIKGADIKLPWETGRSQHLPLLAYAAIYSGNEARKNDLINEVRSFILDFIAFNPPRFGTQWLYAMDVAIRAINFIHAFSVLYADDENSFDREFITVFVNSMYDHGRHIFSNLEYSAGQRGNHYLANLAGLAFIGQFLGHPDAAKWKNKAINEINKEIGWQFNPDGTNFEASTWYHYQSLEIVLLTINFLKDEVQLNQSNSDKINQAIAFAASLSTEGDIPLIGDNDSGCVMKFPMQINDPDHWENYYALWIKALAEMYLNKPADKLFCTPDSSQPYPVFGLYIQKNQIYKAVIRCGSIGQKGKGGHSHNDQLSIVLYYKGIPLISDPGTYVYTAHHELRNSYRSVNCHNTLVVPGKEQNKWATGKEHDLFWIQSHDSKAKCLEFHSGLFIGEHYGYGAPHRRQITFADDLIEILDSCDHPGEKMILFHLHPGATAKFADNKVIIPSLGKPAILQSGVNPEIEEYNYSPAYGVISPALRIILRFTGHSIRSVIRFES
ncbi:MAG: alginate lyase family protein [Candidatus Kapaibacterium sp.]